MLRKRNQQTHIEIQCMAKSKKQQMQHLERPKYQQEEC
jgi:hypothetical protein